MFGNDAENNTDLNDDAGASAYEQMQQAETQTDNDDNGDDSGDGDDDSGEGDDPSKAAGNGDGAENDDADEALEFTFNGEVLASQAADDEDQEGDTDLVKHLRSKLREQRAAFKEKSAQQQAAPQNLPEEIPPAPKMSDTGIDWDQEKYDAAHAEWLKTRDAITERNHQKAQQAEKLNAKLQERTQNYNAERAKVLKVPGFERAEQVVAAEIPQNLQLTLLMNSKNPAGAVLALGRNAALRKQLQEVSGDPVALGYLLAEIDKGAGFRPQAKTTAKGAPPVKSGATQTTIHGLEAAIEKARESGDYTTVLQLKEKLKAAKKAG